MSRWLAFVSIGVLVLALIELVRVGPNASSKIFGGALMLYAAYRMYGAYRTSSTLRGRRRANDEPTAMFDQAEVIRGDDPAVVQAEPVSRHAAPSMTTQSPSRLSSSLRTAHRVAMYIGVVVLVRVVVAMIVGTEHNVLYLITAPVLGYSIFFLVVLALKVSGAIVWDPHNPTSIDVNPWFAWLVGGGLVAFFVSLIGEGRNHFESAFRVALIAALGWAIALGTVWAVRRVLVRRGA